MVGKALETGEVPLTVITHYLKLAMELDEFWLSLVRLGPLEQEPFEEELHRLKVLALGKGETAGH